MDWVFMGYKKKNAPWMLGSKGRWIDVNRRYQHRHSQSPCKRICLQQQHIMCLGLRALKLWVNLVFMLKKNPAFEGRAGIMWSEFYQIIDHNVARTHGGASSWNNSRGQIESWRKNTGRN